MEFKVSSIFFPTQKQLERVKKEREREKRRGTEKRKRERETKKMTEKERDSEEHEDAEERERDGGTMKRLWLLGVYFLCV